jgi:hypothetical protein
MGYSFFVVFVDSGFDPTAEEFFDQKGLITTQHRTYAHPKSA